MFLQQKHLITCTLTVKTPKFTCWKEWRTLGINFLPPETPRVALIRYQRRSWCWFSAILAAAILAASCSGSPWSNDSWPSSCKITKLEFKIEQQLKFFFDHFIFVIHNSDITASTLKNNDMVRLVDSGHHASGLGPYPSPSKGFSDTCRESPL